VAAPASGEAGICEENSMIAIKKALYMTVPLLTVITSCVQANDDGSFTIGLGGATLRDIQVQTSRYGRWFLYCRVVTALSLLIRRKG
jgi:hypothetical protein